MHAGLFDVLHDRADHHGFAVAHRIHVHLDGAVEEAIEQHRTVVGHLHRFAHVALEFFFLVDDFHRPAAQYVGRTHHHRVTDVLRQGQGLVFAARSGVGRLTQVQALHHLLEALAVFGAVDGLRAGADDRYARFFQGAADLQRGLAAVLHDDAFRLLDTDDFQHVFQRHRLEVQAVGGVIVSGDGFRVAVDHDGLVTVFTHGQRSVHAAVVELDALADTVGAATENHDLVATARVGLALFLVGRVHIGGVGGEFGSAGVDALVHRQHFQLVAVRAQALLGNAQQLGQTRVGEALALELEHQVIVDGGQTQGLHSGFVLDQIFDLHQEPLVDAGQLEHFGDALAGAESIGHVPDAVGAGHGQLTTQSAFSFRVVEVELRIEAGNADFQAAQGFLHRLLEGTADGHDFTHGLHLGGQAGVGFREFLEGKTRHLGHHIIDGRLERRRGTTAGDVVGQLVEGVTDSQLGGDLGDREAGGLRGQRRGTRHARVHLDHHHAPGVRADAELHVGAAGFHADLTQHRQRGVAHDLVFLVGQGLRRGNGDRVAGVHAHRVEVLDGADDDAVVLLVADHLHLVFLPADQRFVDQQLVGRRQVQATGADFFEFFTVVGDAAAGAAHGEGRTDDAGEADLLQHAVGFFHIVRDAGNRAGQADVLHRLVETRAVFGLVDGVGVGTDHLDAEFFQDAVLFQIQGAVQRSLATHGRQQRVRALLLDDLGHGGPLDRLDVGGVGHRRVGHDGGRVGVHQNDAKTFFLQRLARLCAGVVELTGLADDDGAGTEDQDAFDVCTFWHFLTLESLGQSAGLAALGHGFDEAVEQWSHIVRAGAGLRVTLEAESVLVGTLDALQGAIEQRLVDRPHIARQAALVHGETVVLTGDHHHARVEILYRVVGTVVAVPHFQGLGAGGQRQQLVTEADAEHRNISLEDFLDRLDRVVARLRIARAIGEEHAIGIQRQHVTGRSLCRYHGQTAAASDQHAQDVQLDAVVVGNDVVRQIGSGDFRMTVAFQIPHAGAPFVRLVAGDFLGQVHALEAGEAARQFQGLLFGNVVTDQDAAVLRAFLTQDSGQATGIDAGDGDGTVLFQVLIERLLVTPVAGNQRQIANDQASSPDAVGLGIFRRGAGIADVRVSQGNDLLGIGWIGKDFLIAGHGGVEHHLSDRLAIGPDGIAAKNAAVSKGQNGRFGGWLSQEDLRLDQGLKQTQVVKKRDDV